jgi:hypothetical protein
VTEGGRPARPFAALVAIPPIKSGGRLFETRAEEGALLRMRTECVDVLPIYIDAQPRSALILRA